MFTRHFPWLIGVTACAAFTGACATNDSIDNGRGMDASVDAKVVVDSGQHTMDSGQQQMVDPRPEIYPTNRTQSPLTKKVVQSMTAIAAKANRADDVFAKIGDSITVNTNFFACFAGANVDLGTHADLGDARSFFGAGSAGGVSPFSRVSASAAVGWSAFKALEGDPSPLEQEIATTNARFGVVMYGTNDIGLKDLDQYADNMLTITDTLIGSGVVPILSSIPPRAIAVDDPLWVDRANTVVRGIAQARMVPFVDYHREMVGLFNQGLGGDSTHPSVYTPNGEKGCLLTADGLAYGYNVRNWVTLEALSRAKDVLVDDEEFLDAPAGHMDGTGTHTDPYIVGSLPFTHIGDTSKSSERRISQYTGCSATQNESGPEVYYAIDVTDTVTVSAFVLDRGNVDIDVHALQGTADANSCVQRNHIGITETLTPARWYFALDTFVDESNVELKGEYMFALLVEED
ncbi:MAG: SGNH/GDSL hydrolase family protein [Myxococcales bacterium]|nr:SGNH/GDSL hydrolase family protein [Myxococcales bacterium]